MSTLDRHHVTESPLQRFHKTRQFTEELCRTLTPEDATIQSMPDASPARWHLAHTTWFFETFLLARQSGYEPFCDGYDYLYNSYYNSVGAQFPRSQRGLISRPSLAEIYEYRRHVDQHADRMMRQESFDEECESIVLLGVNHEQQHQELILTDIKHALSLNPLQPAFRDAPPEATTAAAEMNWIEYPGGVHAIGHAGGGFAYDNESPRHETLLRDFELASRPVANGEFLQFIDAGGYQQPQWWLSDGWRCVQENSWSHPLYWERHRQDWRYLTLGGPLPVDPAAPVCHVSYFEADAFARWAGARLPTEAEWEAAAAAQPIRGNFADTLLDAGRALHPACTANGTSGLAQAFGDVWEWTASPYVGYPGYRPQEGALGEYNGKFMCNQFVLRGGSCATPNGHVRATYRNFFAPSARWQFSGIRLARDA